MDSILIADDEKEIRTLLRLYLENEGYRVDEAADGDEAMENLRRAPSSSVFWTS